MAWAVYRDVSMIACATFFRQEQLKNMIVERLCERLPDVDALSTFNVSAFAFVSSDMSSRLGDHNPQNVESSHAT
jgi:hypothetical protein